MRNGPILPVHTAGSVTVLGWGDHVGSCVDAEEHAREITVGFKDGDAEIGIVLNHDPQVGGVPRGSTAHSVGEFGGDSIVPRRGWHC